MSRKELLDIVKKLERRLLEQIKIVKERDDRIAGLEEKLQSQTQQNCQIRKLALKIGRLCDPAGRNRETSELSELTTHTRRSPIVKRTAGRPIFLASDILDHASVSMKMSNSDDDSVYHYRRHQDSETTAGGPVELSQNHQQEPIRRDSEFYSTSGHIDRKGKHKKKKKCVGVLDVKHSRKSQERTVKSQNRQENPQQSASPQRLDANPRKLSQSPKIDLVKTDSTQFKRRKRRKAKRKPPKFSPRTSPMEDLMPPKEDHARGSSVELILATCSTRLSTNVSPQVSPVPQEEFRSRMSVMSGADSASDCSEGKGEQSNQFRRSISDRSLSSLVKVLPSIPSQYSADDLSIRSLVHLGNLNRDRSKEKEFTDWGEEGITNVLI